MLAPWSKGKITGNLTKKLKIVFENVLLSGNTDYFTSKDTREKYKVVLLGYCLFYTQDLFLSFLDKDILNCKWLRSFPLRKTLSLDRTLKILNRKWLRDLPMKEKTLASKLGNWQSSGYFFFHWWYKQSLSLQPRK